MKISLKEIKRKYRTPRDKEINMYWFGRVVHANLAMPFVKLFLYTSITPNQITLFWILLGFLGTFMIALQDYWLVLIGALILQLYLILDFTDGTLARLKRTSFEKGAYLEMIGHNILHSIMFIGVTMGVFIATNNILYVILGLLATSCASIHALLFLDKIQIIIDKKAFRNIGHSKKSKKNFMPSLLSNLHSKIYFMYTSDMLTNFITLAAIFSSLHLVLIFYGITYPILILSISIYEYYRGFDWVYDLFRS